MDDLNLNSQLISNDSPLTKSEVVSAYDYDSQTERGAVRSMHIKDFSFSQGTGGTLTLTEGMTIKNSDGTTIIDSTGLNSTNNFSIYGGTGLPDGTVTGTVATPVPSGTFGTIILSRPTIVYFWIAALLADKQTVTETTVPIAVSSIAFNIGTNTNVLGLISGGVRQWSDGGTALTTYWQYNTASRIKLIDAGTHPAILTAYSSDSGGTAIWRGLMGGYCAYGN